MLHHLVVFLQRTLLRQIIPVRGHGIVIPHDIQITELTIHGHGITHMLSDSMSTVFSAIISHFQATATAKQVKKIGVSYTVGILARKHILDPAAASLRCRTHKLLHKTELSD